MSTEIQQETEQSISAKSSEVSLHKPPSEDAGLVERVAQEEYATRLENALQARTDIVVDFSCLKTCLDPLNQTSENQEEQQFDYTEFVHDLFDNHSEKLSSVQSLVLRNLQIPSPSTNDQFDKYAKLCYGMLQLSSLTELDLSGNKIPETMQANLQLWNLQNINKLVMDKTSLKSLHASVGRLRKLKVLSLSGNQLNNLPVTLGFCENLRVLNIQKNQFRQLPGVLLKLEKLEELRRLDNPLTPRYDMQAPHYVRTFQQAPQPPAAAGNTTAVKYNPRSLQLSCTKNIFSLQIDYWQQTTLGPLQCKILDHLGADFAMCEHCQAAISNPGRFTVEVMLVTFVGLSGVPFKLEACSKVCQDNIKDIYGKKNVELQARLDKEYEENIRKAQKLVDRNEVDISPETINAPEEQVFPFTGPYYGPFNNNNRSRRRRHKKCTIM